MKDTPEILNRLETLLRRDLDQRLQGVMNALLHDRPVMMGYELEVSSKTGSFEGHPMVGLPRYVRTEISIGHRDNATYRPLHFWDESANFTKWIDYPVLMDNGDYNVWPTCLQFSQTLLPSKRLFDLILENWEDDWARPFHMNIIGQFEVVYDKRREIEWLQQRGVDLVMMLFRNPKDVLSIDRKFEQAFTRAVDVGMGRQSLRTVEDFDLALRNLSERQGLEVESHSKHSDSMDKDDSDFIQWLRDQAFLIKSKYGKDAGDVAFQMLTSTRKQLSRSRPI